MRFSKQLLLLLLFVLCHKLSYAQTTIFTVTSNADSGPGTLREGLTLAAAANRTNPFVINFQLPGVGTDHINRTIRLRTALPTVTSNVIIDGSSQASWPALGVSGAKIILEPEYANFNFSGLTIGSYSTTNIQTTNVEIYGLFIRNFANITNFQTVNMGQGSGIIIDYRANNITIGAAGKGNVIGGNINGILIQNNYYFNNNTISKIKIQSNLIGVIYDGITPNTNVIGVSANLYDCNLDLGGDNTGDGNVIAANRINVDINRSSYTTARFDVNVVNNKIGVDYTGQKDFHELPIFLSSSSLEISGLKINAVNTALYVRNNTIGGNRTMGLSIANADFILTGNFIGTDASTGTINLGNGFGIKIEAGAGGTIGGATGAEKNTIANNSYGIESVSAKPVKITQNSMYCNKVFGIGKAPNITQPYIQILKRNPNYVSGKATPNSDVELFYTSNCQGICEGKTYIATVQTGTDGRWIYNGSITGLVTATANLLNATTSPFATPELLPNEAVIQPVTCNYNGSITIAEPRENFTFTWVKIESDGTKLPMGNTQSINNLDVGTYEVTINDGCQAIAKVFEIKDQKLTKPTIVPPTISCGQTMFTYTAQVLRGNGNISYTWTNTITNTVVSNSNPANLPEGTYIVTAKDQANCILDSDPITINRKKQPKITSTLPATSEDCGRLNGAIKGLSISDETGTLSYKWFKLDDRGVIGTDVIATTLDLENVAGGRYVLFIYDDGQCSPVQQNFSIPTNNIVAINMGISKDITCNHTGSITGVRITDADTYEWIKPDGTRLIKAHYSPGMNIDISNLVPGTYTLIASNSLYFCERTATSIIRTIPPTVFSYTLTNKINATCGRTNGGITLDFSTIFPTTYEWRDESGNLIPSIRTGNKIELKNLAAGNYKMLVKDVNGCASEIGPFNVELIPILTIVSNTGKPVNDGCSLKRGAITGIKVIGGIPEYDFKWINEKGEAVQYTQDLVNATAGKYRLEVTDKTFLGDKTCGYALSEEYIIEDVPFKVEAPTVNDLRVCYVSDITLPVIAAQEGRYQLFASLSDTKPILENTNGIFKFKVAKTADYYIRRVIGSCSSEFTKVHIEVTYDNMEISNAMTPNGDGRNDIWEVKGLPDYKGNSIKVYSRAGQLVYESIGNYTKPFDGRFRGEELPAGVYYYIIDLRAECKPISGSITLLR